MNAYPAAGRPANSAMLYQAYDTQTDFMSPLRMLIGTVAAALPSAVPQVNAHDMFKKMAAAYQVFSRARITHVRPPFGIGSIISNGRELEITEEKALVLPFGTLLHFRKSQGGEQPAVLIVAPMSGHFATLLRETVRTVLADHDVYITDWHNARDVPSGSGTFGFDEYVEHLIAFLGHMGTQTHMLAICQPCVAALAATAIMAEDGNESCPRSLTLMAGPVDTRVNPTGVNRLATSRPIEWFEQNLICRVPGRYAGAGRQVYPGFLQLMAFMSMNMDKHVRSFVDLYRHLVEGNTAKADATIAFYDEYLSVLDLPAPFFLETVRTIFQEYALPLGQLKYRGRTVDLGTIRHTALLTVEGERDDICAVGQTVAAHDLCTGMRPYLKTHYMQVGVGHYGVFSGRKWMNGIYPVVRDMIQVTR